MSTRQKYNVSKWIKTDIGPSFWKYLNCIKATSHQEAIDKLIGHKTLRLDECEKSDALYRVNIQFTPDTKYYQLINLQDESTIK